jgi:hypothetical protein
VIAVSMWRSGITHMQATATQMPGRSGPVPAPPRIDGPEGVAVTLRGTVVPSTGYYAVKDMFAHEMDFDPPG